MAYEPGKLHKSGPAGGGASIYVYRGADAIDSANLFDSQAGALHVGDVIIGAPDAGGGAYGSVTAVDKDAGTVTVVKGSLV